MVSTVINESSRTALEGALPCDCSARTETGKFLKCGFKIEKIILFSVNEMKPCYHGHQQAMNTWSYSTG